MRDFFIRSLEKVIAVVIVLLAIGVVIGTVAIAFAPDGGILAALVMLVGGALYVILIGGMLYLGLGIYHNTLKTAAATEALLAESKARP